MVSIWYRIWYRTTLAIFILLSVGFSVVIPLDCIIQASSSSNNALNTFIVVGAIVAFVVFLASISTARFLIFKRALQDVPKRYIPTTEEDMPHKRSREHVVNSMKKAAELSELFKKPKEPVFHAGLEPKESEQFPAYFRYADPVKYIADRFRFDGAFLGNFITESSLGETIGASISKGFEKEERPYKPYLNEYISLYEKFRFSDKDIERDELVRFMKLYAILSDFVVTSDRSPMTNHKFLRVSTDEDYDYDPDTRSHSESEVSISSKKHQNLNTNLKNSSVVSRLTSLQTGLNFTPDESEEPPQSHDEYQRYHELLHRVESYNTVVHR